MECTFRRVRDGGIALSLPCFPETETLKNEYYCAMEDGIVSFVKNSAGAVRRYSAESQTVEENGVLTVRVKLSARLVTPRGITVRRRVITDRWDGDALVSHTVTDP